MIPRIATGGTSFKGAFQYYLHDKDATTRTRVAWTHTENILTDEPDKAWRVMAYTAKEQARLKEAAGQAPTGRKLTKPVFSYSLSWHPEQRPNRDHMLATARRSLAVLGLNEHETVIIAHRDEPQHHVHVIVNRVHPITGIAAKTSHSKLRLSEFAHEYELDHGKVYCRQREENHRKRREGERTMYHDPVIAEAWERSDDGRGFANALAARGYRLAKGRRRLVVLDPYGQAHNPVRHLEGIRTNDFQKRLHDLDITQLPEADELGREIRKTNKERYHASLRHDEQAAKKTNLLQERQREEEARISQDFRTRLEREREDLSANYGLRDSAREIAQLRKRTDHPRWWQTLFGFTRRMQQKLETLELNHKNAEWRMREKLQSIETEQVKTLGHVKLRHASERQRLEEHLRTVRPHHYANYQERAKLREAFASEPFTRSEEGPILERE